jgi:hypothetical protein
MEGILGVTIAVLVFAMIFTVDKTVKYYKQKELFELVSWSAIGDYNPVLNRYSYINDLIFAIRRAQQIDTIDAKYKIVEDDDFKLVRAIVEEYQKNITRLYFRDTLGLPKTKYVISETDYFMAAFHDFLSEHSAESEFMGRDMYSERKDYKSYEGDGYRATYVMSEFGILYYKLFYITHMYCKQSVVYQNKVAGWEEKNIKAVLDTNEIEISFFRH